MKWDLLDSGIVISEHVCEHCKQAFTLLTRGFLFIELQPCSFCQRPFKQKTLWQELYLDELFRLGTFK
jgi:hypothetical protein